MKQFWLQVSALILVAIIALVFLSYPNLVQKSINLFNSQSGEPASNKLIIVDKATVNVEAARTKEQRMKGLSDRPSLASDSGMLFVYEKSGRYQFWMKGMQFKLDFIWISGGQIVDLLTNVPVPPAEVPDASLPVYTANTDFDKVLEINAGFVADHNIKPGDKIKLN